MRIFAVTFLGLAAWMLAVQPISAEPGDPPGRVARLSYLQGQVSREPAGESDWSAASPNYVLTTGDRLYTGVNSRVELEIGPYVLRMSQTTASSISMTTPVLDHEFPPHVPRPVQRRP